MSRSSASIPRASARTGTGIGSIRLRVNRETLSVGLTFAALGVILIGAALFRFNGLAWDSGYLFHPDERQILFVATRLRLPSTLAQFFSADSPLNPKFFAYGSFPVYLLRLLSGLAPANSLVTPWSDQQLASLALLGRFLSGMFDLGTLLLMFLLARRLYDKWIGLIVAACMALTVLEIQLAHFYAVDTLLTLLVTATLYFAARFAQQGQRRDLVATGIAFGLAMATKVTALPLIVPIVVAGVRADNREDAKAQRKQVNRLRALVSLWSTRVWTTRKTLVTILGIAMAVFIVTQPYALLDPIQYFGQVGTEWLVARGWLDFPYTRQYAGTIPFLYQIVQSSVWGMGLPLGIFAWGGSALFVARWWRTRELVLSGVEGWRDGFVLSWAFFYFTMIGAEYTKYLRYLLPLLPFLFLMAAVATQYALRNTRRILRVAYSVGILTVLFSSLLYSLAFSSIYSREHPWLQISQWIYQNIPAHSTLAVEHWDNALPVPMQVAGASHSPTEYQTQVLPMFDPDNAAKLQTLVDTLAKSDYVILASPRLYATIPRLSSRYPMSSRYYHLLFDGQLGFDLVAYARNDPSLGGVTITNDTIRYAGLTIPPALAAYHPSPVLWDWGHADESFTVYDQPMPLVFKKTRALSAAELRALLSP
jgi:Dolichyl-phosphate-mannose-protein mannosyltransferase